MKKVKNCYGCPAHDNTGCLLGFERNETIKNVNFGGAVGHITIYSPKICCHKPKSEKEFFKIWKSKTENEE